MNKKAFMKLVALIIVAILIWLTVAYATHTYPFQYLSNSQENLLLYGQRM